MIILGPFQLFCSVLFYSKGQGLIRERELGKRKGMGKMHKLQVKLLSVSYQRVPVENCKREKLKGKRGNRMQKWAVTQQHRVTRAIHAKE